MSPGYKRVELRTVRRLLQSAVAGLVLAVSAVFLVFTGPVWSVGVVLAGCAAVTASTVVSALRLHQQVEARRMEDQ